MTSQYVMSQEDKEYISDLVEAESRGLMDDHPEQKETLRVMRQRGFAPADPFTLSDTTPIEMEVPPAFQGENQQFVAPGVLQKFQEKQARAETGQREDPLETGDNFKLGLSLNPNKELRKILGVRFGKDVPVRFDPNTDRYQYLSPEDNRVVSVGQTGFDSGDIARGAAELPVIAGDVAGSIIGGVGTAVVTKNPAAAIAGEATGAALGTYIGEISRLALGQKFGVNQDVTVEQMHESAMKKAGFAGGATVVAGTGIQTAKGIVNFVTGKAFSKEAALRHGLQSQEADAVIGNVNKMLERTGEKLRTTTAKRSDDALALSDEAVVRREREFIQEFAERDASDERALMRAFDEISPVSETGGESVTRKFAADRRARIDTVENALEQSKQTLQDNLDAIGVSIPGDTVAATRGAISEKRTVVNNQVKRVNNVWLRQSGANAEQTASQVQIPVGGNTKKLVSALDAESENAIVNVTKGDRANIFTKSFSDKESVDLIDYQRAISDLRTTVRSASKNESVSKGQVTVMKRTLKALIKDRDDFLRLNNRDDLFFSIRSSDVFTREARDMLDRSVAGDLMVKSGNRFKVKNKDFFDTAFVKGGKQESEDLHAVIGGNQPAVQAWRSEILNKYKNTVFPEDKTTKASVKAHRQFMTDYSDAMRPFFNKTEMAQINKLGGMVKVVEKQEAQATRILSALNKAGVVQGAEGRTVAHTRKTLDTLEPEQVAPWITANDKVGPARARGTVKLLESQPRVLEGIRGEVRLNMRNEVAPDGVINPSAFNSHIRKNAATYRDLFGQKYVDDLFQINKALEITQRKGTPTHTGESMQIPVQIARGTVARPLSKEGRLLTAGLLFKLRKGKRAIARALLNPEDLSVLAELSTLNPSTRRATELAASVGILEFMNEDLGEQ